MRRSAGDLVCLCLLDGKGPLPVLLSRLGHVLAEHGGAGRCPSVFGLWVKESRIGELPGFRARAGGLTVSPGGG